MKEYNRKTKRWEESKDPGGSLKKRELCKGGRPHNFIPCLQRWVNCNKVETPELIAAYYALREEEKKSDQEFKDRERKLLGLNSYEIFIGGDYKEEICTVCARRKTLWNKK